MFASLAVIALAMQQITIPIGPKPRVNERERAPIATAGPAWAAACGTSTDWNQPAPPVRIHANTYLVGTCGISAAVAACCSAGTMIAAEGSLEHLFVSVGAE